MLVRFIALFEICQVWLGRERVSIDGAPSRVLRRSELGTEA
jgi:hypothetical protein